MWKSVKRCTGIMLNLPGPSLEPQAVLEVLDILHSEAPLRVISTCILAYRRYSACHGVRVEVHTSEMVCDIPRMTLNGRRFGPSQK